jgi:hypothetical protein
MRQQRSIYRSAWAHPMDSMIARDIAREEASWLIDILLCAEEKIHSYLQILKYDLKYPIHL